MADTTTALVATTEHMVVPYAEIERMAGAIAKSGLFGLRTPEQAITLMLLAQAEGLHPAAAARDYHIIDGRPSLKADTMLARFLHSGGRVEWHELSDAAASATFSHPTGGKVRIDWDIERAKRARLLAKDIWQKYPRQMLRARVVSEGVRTVNPGVNAGLYTPEEIIDGDFIDDVPPSGARGGIAHLQSQWDDNGAAAGAPAPAPAPAAKVTVEVQPEPAEKPKSRKAIIKPIALELGLEPDQVTACLFNLGWPTTLAELSEERFEELKTKHLPAWTERKKAEKAAAENQESEA